MRRAGLAVVAGTVLSAVLAGCSGSDDSSDGAAATLAATPTASATAPTIDLKEPACSFLTAAERKKLTGLAVDEVSATSGTQVSSQCRWQASAALVQLTTLPAKEWAKTLPTVVAQLEKSTDISSASDKQDLARAKKLLAGAASFSDKQACGAFTTLAEIGGAPKGATMTVAVVPISETDTGISAQTCSSGELTSIIYSVPDLRKSATVEAAVTSALDAAQRRAVAAR